VQRPPRMHEQRLHVALDPPRALASARQPLIRSASEALRRSGRLI
jgi:hypothetical protein